MSETVPVWIDGRLVEPGAAGVSVFDHGVTVGDGCFETLRTERGRPFAATRHLRRLRRSLDGLGLALPTNDATLREALQAVASALHGPGKLRLTVTAGPGPMGSGRGGAGSHHPTVYVVGSPLDPWPVTGSSVVVPWRRNEHGATVGIKSTSYAENVIALAEAQRSGAGEALFANTAGQLCEGSGTNVFVVRDGVVSTPPLLSGCLAGITRELLLELDPEIREVPLPIGALDEADEVFLTSSTRDVQGQHSVNGRPLEAPGPHTARLAAAFAALAAADDDP